MSIHLVPGTTSIIVDDASFCNGYEQGYHAYTERQERNPMTPMQVYTFIVRTLLTLNATDRFHTGYLTGWIAALYQVEETPSLLSSLYEQCVQEAEVSA